MRAIIVKYNDTIQAVSVVNEDRFDHAISQLGKQIEEQNSLVADGDSGWRVENYAIDAISTVIDFCIPRS